MQSILRRAFGRAQPVSLWDDGDPIRSELFSVERLEQHAESLAADQLVSAKPPTARSLVDRLADNERVLLGAYRSIAKAVDEGRPITPAAEWLLDNYHLVEQQVREVRTDLPAGYYRQLPKLRSGPLAGYPRVFGVAWAFVAHTDSRFDPEALTRFVRAYQTVQPLSIGELWAVAITLRIVLVENLRRSAVRIMSRRSAREEADSVADRLMGVNDRVADPAALAPYQRLPFSEGFFVQLVQRLRDQDPETTPAVGWLQEQLKREGTTADEMVRREHQLQGATNVTVRNIITSMRLISDVDWAKLFEAVSPVDDVLRAGSDFAAMDFATRNLYRTAIEQIARGTELAEVEIARRALEAAASSPDMNGDQRQRDPGYHLIGGGRPAFERSVRFRPSGLALRRRFAAAGIAGYVASVSFTAAVVLFLPLLVLAQVGLTGWQGAVMVLIGLLPAIDAALLLVNRAITGGFGAMLLPGLELRAGVPPQLRTLVAIPTLLSTRASVDEQLQRLEVHYLANPGGAVHFALLSDWTDANAETNPGDADLVAAAVAGIVRLNSRHPTAEGADRFLLLHRRRVWNEAQGRWMGWERKRGKLHELNRLLRGATDTTFLDTGTRSPADIRYVVTLDSDTRLPRDAIQRLVGKMAPPAQPAASRRHREPGGRRLWRAAAARHAVLAGRRGRLAVPEGLLPQQRHRSLLVGGVGRLPGPVRRGLLLRQGHLRHRRVRGRAARPGARQCDAEPRSLRRCVRPLGPGVRHRGGRGVPRPLRRRRGTPAPVGARRLAAAALAARPREGQPGAGSLQRRHGDRLLEDVRQSAADLVGAGGVRCAAGGVDPAASRRARLDGLRPADGRPADDPAGDRGPCAAECRHHDAQPFFGACVGYRQRSVADRPARGLSASPGLADAGCDRPDHVPAVRQSPPPARLDHLGPVQQQAR